VIYFGLKKQAVSHVSNFIISTLSSNQIFTAQKQSQTLIFGQIVSSVKTKTPIGSLWSKCFVSALRVSQLEQCYQAR
jgi:hypothetical protein